jgi:hypothetical protein
MNYGSIRTHFKATLNRSDITDTLADTFIDQGIGRIQRSLRIPAMEGQHTYTFTTASSSVFLPSNFLEIIDLYYDNTSLIRLPMKEMQNVSDGNETGNPVYFCREGGNLLLMPRPSSGKLVLNYYASFPEMTSDSDENILASIASDLIMYSALTYASDYYLDERTDVFEGKYQQFMNELQEQANDQEIVGTIQAIRPSYYIDY